MTEKKLLILLREVVSARAGGRCEFPGCKNTDCDPHHTGGRGNAVKYDPDTCMNLCSGHHTSGAISAHGKPEIFKQIIIESGVRSAEWFDEVNRKKNLYAKDGPDDREKWKERLQNELIRSEVING